jgi:hypothetical protein
MGAAFRPEVLTGARRTLNLVVAPVIRCLAGDPATSRTESPAEETIKLGIARFRISNFAIRISQSLT